MNNFPKDKKDNAPNSNLFKLQETPVYSPEDILRMKYDYLKNYNR